MGPMGHTVMQTLDDAACRGFAQRGNNRMDQRCACGHREPAGKRQRKAHMGKVTLIHALRVMQEKTVQYRWGRLHSRNLLTSVPCGGPASGQKSLDVLEQKILSFFL